MNQNSTQIKRDAKFFNAWKKLAVIGLFILGIQHTSFSQYEKWDFQGYAIGQDASGAAICAMGAMPDIARIDTQYLMYYIAKYGTANAIYYASSPDMITWTVKDTIMVGSTDTSNRIYDLGGPGVLKLANGQYRLFYRTSQKMPAMSEPLFHIRSMISADGIHFVHEAGVRVENYYYDTNSYFKSASHPSVYKDQAGNTRAIITGRDTSMNLNSPAGLYTAYSPDEGLTWTNFAPLYSGCHDPIVVKDFSGKYHMYTSLFGYGHREAASLDGITWPSVADSMTLMQGTAVLTEESSPNLIADLGAGVDTTGKIVLYSNFKPAGPGPWRDIAYYFIDPTSGVNEKYGEANTVVPYPNPATECILFKSTEKSGGKIVIFNLWGECVYSETFSGNEPVNCKSWESGLYFYTINYHSKRTAYGKFMKQ